MKVGIFLKVIKLYFETNYKTLIFNFHYLPLKQAIYLPVKVNKNCVFHALKGTITIKGAIHPSMIHIGFGYVGIFDRKRQRTIWENWGEVIFEGSANIGHGSKLSIGINATLTIGENFKITAESSIICFKKISFKKNVLLSWDILVMDTDFHKIVNKEKKVVNAPKAIEIGEHCWIGCRSLILKGTTLPDNSIVGAGTIIAGTFEEENTVIAKNPATAILKNIEWIN